MYQSLYNITGRLAQWLKSWADNSSVGKVGGFKSPNAHFYFLVIDRDPSEIPSALINEKIPVFVTSSLFDKNNFVSSNEFGKEVTLVNFFATWCGPCRIEHSYLQHLSNDKKITRLEGLIFLFIYILYISSIY